MGLLDCSAVEREKLSLAEPRLITMNVLQSAMISPGQVIEDTPAVQKLLYKAEGKVLELLVRKFLLKDILNLLGLGEQLHDLVWGKVGPGCEVDFAIVVNDGPVVWVSCKRSQAQQTLQSFQSQIEGLAEIVAKGECLNDVTVRLWQGVQRGLKLVAVSAVAAGAGYRAPGPEQLIFTVDEKDYNLQCSWHDFLFLDLLEPLQAEPLTVVRPVGASPRVTGHDTS